jgi:hypothetical protein
VGWGERKRRRRSEVEEMEGKERGGVRAGVSSQQHANK